MKKFLKSFLVIVCILAMICGCGKKEATPETAGSALAETEEAAETAETAEEIVEETNQLDKLKNAIQDTMDSAENFSALLEESNTLNGLVEIGFKTDADLSQKMAPGTVSDLISVEIMGYRLQAKFVNVMDSEQELRACVLAKIFIDDAQDSLIRLFGFQCGETKYEDVLEQYMSPYFAGEDRIIVKSFQVGALLDYKDQEDAVLKDDGERNILFDFADETLKSISYEIPSLLYRGLDDNVEQDTLETMTEEQLQQTEELRDSIVKKLADAFAKENIKVQIDEETGEITMDSTLLFATDEYQLSKDGKAFLDQYFHIYVSVLLSEEFKDSVTGIRFEGHTDTTADYEYNLELSQKRADTVMEYCLSSEEKQLSKAEYTQLKEKAEAVGYSFSDPIYKEDGKVDMAASRRVAIKFYITVK